LLPAATQLALCVRNPFQQEPSTSATVGAAFKMKVLMSKNDALRYGAPGAGAVRLGVDMQRIFAEGTEWKMPWFERVSSTPGA
jgi:hypothetical protein